MGRTAKTSPSSSRLSTSSQGIIVNFDCMVVVNMMSFFLSGCLSGNYVDLMRMFVPCLYLTLFESEWQTLHLK